MQSLRRTTSLLPACGALIHSGVPLRSASSLSPAVYNCSRPCVGKSNKPGPSSRIITRCLATAPTESKQQQHLQQEEPNQYEKAKEYLAELDKMRDRYMGISQEPFPKEVANVLLNPIDPMEIELKPDGMIYLPEIKYRRILNKAFGPGGWALMPLTPPVIERGNLIRTYALYCFGRFVSEAIGEQAYFEGVHSTATATEAAKSNALVRCCKDLGIGSELWDPNFIEEWKRKNAVQILVENEKSKEKKRFWRRKDRPPFEYPWREIRQMQGSSQPSKPAPVETDVDQSVAEEEPIEIPVIAQPTFHHPPQQPHHHPPQQHQAPQQQQQQQQQQAHAEKRKSTAHHAAPEAGHVDLNSEVPSAFRKYAGQAWLDMLQDDGGLPYLEWAARSMLGERKQIALDVLNQVKAAGGVDNLVNSRQ